MLTDKQCNAARGWIEAPCLFVHRFVSPTVTQLFVMRRVLFFSSFQFVDTQTRESKMPIATTHADIACP